MKFEFKNIDEIRFGYGLKLLLPILAFQLTTSEKVSLKSEYFLLESKTILDMMNDEYMCTIQDEIKIKYDRNAHYILV